MEEAEGAILYVFKLPSLFDQTNAVSVGNLLPFINGTFPLFTVKIVPDPSIPYS